MVTRKVGSLVDAQASARDKINDRVLAFLTTQVMGFEGWYDTAAVAVFAKNITTAVEAGQKRTASLTDAYLSRVISDALGKAVPAVGVSIDPSTLRDGVEHSAVYERLAAEYRYKRSLDQTHEAALSNALNRGLGMAQMDLTLAMRASAQQVYERRSNVVSGYRRVLHPERSRGGSCGLCAAASDRVYKVGSLLPIHERCRCETLPIVNDVDPGRALNHTELSAIYSEADSTKAADLKRVKVRYAEHGELGPVLRDRADHFRGPAQVADVA